MLNIEVCHLQQSSRRVLLCVHDQGGAVPEGQTIAQEDDEPHVSGEKTHDQTFSNSPALCRGQVPVVPLIEQDTKAEPNTTIGINGRFLNCG